MVRRLHSHGTHSEEAWNDCDVGQQWRTCSRDCSSGMYQRVAVALSLKALQLENCQVTANVVYKRPDQTEYHAVQLGASDRPGRTTTHQMKGHFRKAKVPSKYIVREFPVTSDAHIPVGKFSNLWTTLEYDIYTLNKVPRCRPFILSLDNM